MIPACKTSTAVLGRFAALAIAVSLISPCNVHAQTVSILYDFGNRLGDPVQPSLAGIVAQGRDGNLYTSGGGGDYGYGAIFKITPTGELTVLYSFNGIDGSFPNSGLTLGHDGNFYGTASNSGTFGFGTVFKVTPQGRLTTLYNFTGGSNDGGYPRVPPILGIDGNLYGTTPLDGAGSSGTVYKITPSGTFTTLYRFDGPLGGANPLAPLLAGVDGRLYGTTFSGGKNGLGVLFSMTTAGKLRVLYNFDDVHGAGPLGPLVQAYDSNFYGTTIGGGSNNAGVIFRITPAGALTDLHNVNGTTDGQYPYTGVVQATDGSLYGANADPSAYGTIFRVTTYGLYSVLYNFDGITGAQPYVPLVQHTGGVLYGETTYGGTGDIVPCNGGCGISYSLNVGLRPFVTLLSTVGKVGKNVQILGQGFAGTADVSFNGTPALFKVVKDTFLIATVPPGATSGFVTVRTPGGTLRSNNRFRIKP